MADLEKYGAYGQFDEAWFDILVDLVNSLVSTAIHDLSGVQHNPATLAELNAKISDAIILASTVIQFKDGALHTVSDHENGGTLEISVLGLSGLLADPQTPLAHALGTAHNPATLAELNAKISDATLDKASDPRTDVNAIHKNVEAEIVTIDEKGTPVGADLVIIEDSAAGNVKKKAQLANLPSSGGNMLKSVYDPNDDGVVVDSDKLEGSTKAEVQNHTATDPTAIHEDVSAEISGITEKVATVDNDLVVIEDSEASNAKKRVKLSNLPTGEDAQAIHDDEAGEIAAVTEKVVPVDNDLVLIEDSEAANTKKRVKLSNLPTGEDPEAIHEDESGEIATITEKVTPVDNDLVLIEDSEASNAKKRVKLSNLPTGGDPQAIHDDESGELVAITEKVTPADADVVLIEDSEAGNVKKRVQVINLRGSSVYKLLSKYVIWVSGGTYYAMNENGGLTSNANLITLLTSLVETDADIYAKAGTYVWNGKLTDDVENLSIIGAGMESTKFVKSVTGTMLEIASGAHNLTLKNLKLDGGGYAAYGGLVYAAAGSFNRLTVDGCRITNAVDDEPSGCGISIEPTNATVNDLIIKNCEIDNLTYGIKTYVQNNLNRVWILNNKVHDIGYFNGSVEGGEGIYVGGRCQATARNAQYINISNNMSYGNRLHGIRVSHKANLALIKANICYLNGLGNLDDYIGDGITTYDLQNAIVEGNILFQNYRHGFSCWSNHSENYPLNLKIRGNLMDNNVKSGMVIGGQNTNDISIVDNTITNNGDEGVYISALSGYTAYDYIIALNRIFNNGSYGIYLGSRTHYFTLLGNNARENLHGTYDILYPSGQNHDVDHNKGRVGTS